MTNGAVYSNYFYVYNVYTAGMMKGTSKNPFASYSAGDAYVWNVFHNFVESGGGAITSSIVGTYSNNLVQIAESMNIRKDVDYTSAADIISPSLMSKAGVILGSLKLGHNGNAPIMEDVPTSGNIAKYGNYTLSQLYRQGGQDVDWGWDITAPITYPDENGLAMIDGILASEAKYSDPAWIGFHSKAPDYVKNGYHSITFNYDVDVSVQTINVFVGTSELQQGIDAPDTIELLCDGVSVATVTPADAATESGLATEKVVIDVNKTGKTFELRFTNYAWVFVSEVQLMAYQPQVHSCAPDGSGWKSDSNGHWKVCSCGEKLNSTSHTAGSWVTVTQADVDKEGKKELRCSVCNYLMDTETIPATHAPATNNWYNNENQHWQTCGCGEKLNTAPHDDGKWVVTKKAEIGVDGKKELRCTVCDYLLKTETIPAITEDHVHSPEDRWSYDADSHWQYCECGEEMNDSAHVEGDWVIVKDAEIGVQGKKAVYCEICEYKIKSETIPALKDDTSVKPPVDDPVIPPSGGDETPEPEFMLGDINDNDKIDMTDYILLKRAYFGTYNFTEIQNLAGDINQNNKIVHKNRGTVLPRFLYLDDW